MRSDPPTARTRTVWLALIWGLGLSPILFAFLYPRAWRSRDSLQAQNLLLPLDTAILLRQALLVLILLLIGWALVEGVRSARREGLRSRRAGADLWIAALAFCAAALVSAAWGAVPRLRVALVIVPMLLTAVFLLPPVPLRWFAARVRSVLLVYAYGSLVAMAVLPDWAVQRPFPVSWISGFELRLHGLQSHANILAPVLLTYLVLDWLEPRRGAIAWLHRGVVAACLVLTQSKMVMVLLLALFAWRYVLLRWRRGGVPLRMATGVVGIIVLAAPVAVAASAQFWRSDPPYEGASIVEELRPAAGETNLNALLSGRVGMWRATLDVWREHPWIGYGPELYLTDAIPLRMGQTERRRIPVAHAHNQLVQTLGQAGLLGAACLLLYLAAMLVHGVRTFEPAHGVSWALMLALLGRGTTEVPLQFFAGDSTLLLHFVTFSFLLLATRQASDGAARAVTAPRDRRNERPGLPGVNPASPATSAPSAGR